MTDRAKLLHLRLRDAICQREFFTASASDQLARGDGWTHNWAAEFHAIGEEVDRLIAAIEQEASK